MALKISSKAVSQAKSLIAAGKINEDGAWSFNAADGNALFSSVGEDWKKYGAWFLVFDDEADEETKARYKYPYGKGGKIWRRAVIAIKQRASQQNWEELVSTADGLLEAIDKKLGKDEEDSAPADAVERRYFPVQELRLSRGDDGEMIIEGYPIVYEKYANLWGFKEVIRRGAAAKALKRSKEFVLWNHLADMPMAGKRNGTLEATEDEKGVHIQADVSKTVWGRNGYEAIDAELVDKMSFAFLVKKDSWDVEEFDGVKLDVREILEFGTIYDYSPVTYPAYEDTEVVARSKELALRSKPKSGAPDEEAGGTPPEVLREARDVIEQRRKLNKERMDYEDQD